MSKIVQALEKARKDGVLIQTVGASDEREIAVAPTSAGEMEPPPLLERAGSTRRGEELAVRTALDPAALRGVDTHVEVLHKPMSLIAEQYRLLRNRIERLDLERKIRLLALTSASKGEGKSLTATNLACVMAQDATKRVLLVDADLRRPKIHTLLGLDKAPGLAEYLLDRVREEEIFRLTPYFGLTVITAGSLEGHPGELLASPRLNEFMSRARAHFDYVIVDTPPLHPISDVSFLVESLDGVIMVVRADRTSKAALRQAAEKVPVEKILGTVLNRAESLDGRFGYGYRYGYTYGYGSTY